MVIIFAMAYSWPLYACPFLANSFSYHPSSHPLLKTTWLLWWYRLGNGMGTCNNQLANCWHLLHAISQMQSIQSWIANITNHLVFSRLCSWNLPLGIKIFLVTVEIKNVTIHHWDANMSGNCWPNATLHLCRLKIIIRHGKTVVLFVKAVLLACALFNKAVWFSSSCAPACFQ